MAAKVAPYDQRSMSPNAGYSTHRGGFNPNPNGWQPELQDKNQTFSRAVPVPPVQSESGADGGCGFCVCLATFFSYVVLLLTFPLTIWFCFKVVQQYQRAVIFRLGSLRTGSARGGLFFVLPCIDEYRCVDTRTVSFNVPAQEILTRDSVSVYVDAVVFYRVVDAKLAITSVANYRESTGLLAATTLRNILGTKEMSQILTDRSSICDPMQVILDEATDPWGVKIERVEITDVKLPQSLQRAMAAEAEAAREAKAKVIAAEGEVSASKALKEAATIMMESPAALQLRYLQTLATIATEKNSTIIFPLPIDILTPFLGKNSYKQTSPPLPATLFPVQEAAGDAKKGIGVHASKQ